MGLQPSSVPVVDREQKPLMPTTPSRAKRWIVSGKATPFWKRGVFCVRLNRDPSARQVQPVVVGIDPGSKKEAFSVQTAARTHLNIQADAVTWVKDAVEFRTILRKKRRYRNAPCRKNRMNRSRGSLPHSTLARWKWKVRICRWLAKLYPIARFVVEDVKAKTKGQRSWDTSFSPLEIGKNWFYQTLSQIAEVEKKQGWQTKQLRDSLGLTKSKLKLSEGFDAHCVDAWVLANSAVGGKFAPDNTKILFLTPLRFHRRQLHAPYPTTGGFRRPYGGTRSIGFKRGSLVKHPRYGLTYIGGTQQGRVSLHALNYGTRLCTNAKPEDCDFLTYSSWRFRTEPNPEASDGKTSIG